MRGFWGIVTGDLMRYKNRYECSLVDSIENKSFCLDSKYERVKFENDFLYVRGFTGKPEEIKSRPCVCFSESENDDVFCRTFSIFPADDKILCSLLSSLNNKFAICLFDKSEGCVLAVDLTAQSTIYWVKSGSEIWFSTSSFFLACMLDLRPLGVDGLHKHLVLRGQYVGHSYFNKIKALLPGHYIRIANPKQEVVLKKWSVSSMGSHFDCKKFRLSLVKLFPKDAGVLLSGGIDSSIIAKEAGEISTEPIKCYSLTNENDERLFSDWKYAKLLSSSANIVNISVPFRFNPIYEASLDNPILDHDEYGLYCLIESANKNGNKVLMTGGGADELFGGYDNIFRQMYQLSALSHDEWINKLICRYSYTPLEFFNLASNKLYLEILEELKLYFADLTDYDFSSSTIQFRTIQSWFLRHHIYWACRSGRYSLDCVSPFLQPEILQIALGLPNEKWIPYGDIDERSLCYHSRVKQILKEIYSGIIPSEILNRKKQAFPVQYTEITRHYKQMLAERKMDLLVDENQVMALLSGKFGNNAKILYLSYVLWRDLCIREKAQLLS